mmetsp:Transcript_8892/g.37354  ORF Transcript_8892/g.37354 Transcript_8892/m.37354 type:complete len:208 (-) Transcript_8892:311-934(-)
MWLFALAWSSCPPMVLSSLQSASTSSSSGFSGSDRSFWMHVCMMRSESICFLNSSPMNRMFPSMRRRACCMRSARSISARRSARSRSAAVMGAAGASPSSFSAGGGASPASAFAFASAASSASFSAALMAVSPFSNSSWHLDRSTRLNVITTGFSGSGDAGSLNSTPSLRNRSESAAHIVAYSSANVGSVSALSKSWPMSPISVCAS